MGAFSLIILTLLLLTALILFASCLAKKWNLKQAIITGIKKKMFWNMFIRSSLTMYIKLVFIGFTILGSLKWSSISDSVFSLAGLATLVAVLLLPILYGLVMYRNSDLLWST